MDKNQVPAYASLLHAADFKKMPWKNGGGSTTEIAISPANASLEKLDFVWRVSAAEVAKPGPFSRFHGFERTLMVTNKAELTLTFATSGQTRTFVRGEAFRFAGEEDVSAELPKGTVQDLGVIHRRGQLRTEMHYLPFAGKPRSFQITAPTVIFLLLNGKAVASTYPGELKFKLDTGDALRLDPLPREMIKTERLVLFEPADKNTNIVAVEIYDRI